MCEMTGTLRSISVKGCHCSSGLSKKKDGELPSGERGYVDVRVAYRYKSSVRYKSRLNAVANNYVEVHGTRKRVTTSSEPFTQTFHHGTDLRSWLQIMRDRRVKSRKRDKPGDVEGVYSCQGEAAKCTACGWVSSSATVVAGTPRYLWACDRSLILRSLMSRRRRVRADSQPLALAWCAGCNETTL